MNDVLVSWAVPKGPSLNPKDRRMAVHVEDHPVSYFDFEGVIPKGEYGGGDVIVWDWGTWQPEETDNPARAVHQGELKFSLDGEKLKGRFTIVKIRDPDPEKDDWLLIHKADEHAEADWNVDALPRSVKSGRTNDEVAAGADAVWDSRAPAEEANIDLSGAREAPLPDFIDPMKATAVDKAFSDPDWLFEIKFDGYRVQTVVDGRNVRMWTRNKQDAGTYFPRPGWRAAGLDSRAERNRGRRSRGRRRRWQPELQAAAGARRPAARAARGGRTHRVLRLRPALSRRPFAAQRPSRAAQEVAPQRVA